MKIKKLGKKKFPETKLFKEEEALSVKFPFTISDIVVDKLT